jgi:uncharacterized protein
MEYSYCKQLSTLSDVMWNKMLVAERPRTLSDALTRIPPHLRERTELIIDRIKGFGRVMVAFSGGVDSTLVAFLAKLALGNNAIAVTADSPSLPSSELKDAKKLAKLIGIKHMVVRTEELDDPDYTSNPTNRCYFCKKELSSKLSELANDYSIPVILDGTNAEDLRGHRPGAAALSEHGILRPLADSGLVKSDVRTLAEIFGLPNHDKPSMPCLSSRVQYGLTITPERLWRIEKSEKVIRSLTRIKDLRVRDHGNLARIEVGQEERNVLFDKQLLDIIGSRLREFGFTYVTFDVFGFRSGSMNETVLVTEQTQKNSGNPSV